MERELVAAARSGDEAAFASLLEREAPRAFRAVLAIVRSSEDAEDVMQDVSMRAWRHLGGLHDDGRWAAWYRRIAVREALDRAKRRSRVREISIDGAERPDRSIESTDPTGRWNDRLAVFGALARMSTEDRALLGLRFGADLEVPDVATALGIPLGTAKTRLHRALARFAKVMGDPDVDR